MKEYSFRVWNILSKKMLSWGQIFNLPAWEIFPGTPEQRAFEVMQYTGLKDKNRKEIFESDIVKCVDKNSGIEFIAIVEFGNPNGEYNWGWQLRHIKGDKPNLDILLWVEMEDSGATCEVIGNIYENPELLNELK